MYLFIQFHFAQLLTGYIIVDGSFKNCHYWFGSPLYFPTATQMSKLGNGIGSRFFFHYLLILTISLLYYVVYSIHHLMFFFSIFICSENGPRLPQNTGSTVSGGTLTLKPYDVQPAIGNTNICSMLAIFIKYYTVLRLRLVGLWRWKKLLWNVSCWKSCCGLWVLKN